MSLVAFSIRQHRLLNICSLLLVIAGLYAAWQMRREAFPNVQMDLVTVRTDYPGASAEQVEQLIVRPVEEELRSVADIKKMSSIAVENLGLTICELEPNTANKERTITDIQQAIDRITELPADLPDRPAVRELQTRNNPIIEVALSGALPEAEVQRLAKGLETQLLDLPDVATIVRRGWRPRQIWVEVDPLQMRRYQLSLTEIGNQLARQNVNIPGGLVEGSTLPPAPSPSAQQPLADRQGRERIYESTLIRTSGEFHTPEEIGAVVVRTGDQGAPVRVRDLATVRWEFADAATIQRAAGSRAIVLVVIKKAMGDAIRMVDDIRRLTAQFQQSAPPALRVSYLHDFSYFIRRRLNVLTWNGAIGLGLVILSILYFLSPRTAIGAALGIPVAALGSLAAMWALGASINLITMFGMIMVVGMLVDEDLLIAENIHRYLEQHDDPATAVIHGTHEIARSVIATVLTTIAAFVPLLLVSGMIGKFTRWIPLVIIVTLICSLVEALLILPAHLYELAVRFRGRRMTATRDWRWFSRLRAAYLQRLAWCLRHRYGVVACGCAIMIASVVVALKVIPFTLFPQRGLEIFFIRAESPIGTSLLDTEQRFAPIEAAVARLPAHELDTFATQIGLAQNDPDDPFTTRGGHIGQVTVYLKPPAHRRPMEAIMDELRAQLVDTPGLTRITLERVRNGPPVGRAVVVKIAGDDFPVLESLAERVKTALAGLPGVTDIADDYEVGKPELNVVTEPLATARAGLTVAGIGRSVRAAFEGDTATRIHEGDEVIEVRVRLPSRWRNDPRVFAFLGAPNRAGQIIPLTQVAALGEHPSPTAIKHEEGRRSVSVTADTDERVTTPIAVRRALRPLFATLEAESPTYRLAFGGEVEKTDESLHSLQIALLLATILILGILVATLDSYGDALIVLTTIPLGLVGVTLGFLLQGYPFSFLALIGIVGLAGIVVDSAIVLVDFIRLSQRTGRSLTDAALDSAATRFRPIILVSLTTILGVIPSAFGIGGTDPFIQPMALAMNWGLAISTIINLFWVPCLLMTLDDLKHRWLGRERDRSSSNAQSTLV